ncbi:MAG: DUF349 domain-containing protein [Sphingomonadales bacterium]|nr:DUF349 domain-containing protein [Sphingomonadales bacterium]
MELQQLIDQITALSQQEDLLHFGRTASEIKQNFEDQLIELERQEQVKRLDANDAGENYEEVDYKPLKEAFFEAYSEFVAKRKAQQQLQQTLEAQNLKLKKDLIVRLKEVIDNEEKIGSAFQAYKDIHETWKKIGAIPREQREAIQKEYSRLLEIFFYNIKIYKELKDHDYRRNKQLKEDLIFKLKQLRVASLEQRDLEAQLHALQDEWEEIGPVPNEEWELMKGSYWEAVRAIYDKINEHYEAQRQILKANIDAKKALVTELETRLAEVATFTTNRHWETQTAFVLELQAKWKTIGAGNRKDNEAVYQAFRSLCDAFFAAKKNFSKEIDAANQEVVAKKKALIEKAQSIATSTDWKNTAEQLKKLQKQWQDSGSAGQRYENKLWKDFRAACNAFFDARQTHFAGQDAENAENLSAKHALIEALRQYELPSDKQEALVKLREFQQQFNAIGPVTNKERQNTYNAFKTRMDELYKSLKLEGQEKERVFFQAKLESLLASPDKQKLLQAEKQDIRKQIDALQKEINTFENNLGFFARSKGADQLRQDVQKKINLAQEKIQGLKAKLKLIPNE